MTLVEEAFGCSYIVYLILRFCLNLPLASLLLTSQDFAAETPGFFDEVKSFTGPNRNIHERCSHQSWINTCLGVTQCSDGVHISGSGPGGCLCSANSIGLQREAAENGHRPAGAFVQGAADPIKSH